MKLTSSSLFLLLTLLSLQNLSVLSLTAVQYGAEIRDIWAKDDACSTTETNTWTASALWTATIKSTCVSGYPLVGGYGVLGPASAPGLYYTKTYSGLPPHNSIYFTLTVWPIDSWDDPGSGNFGYDYIGFSFDGVTFTGYDWSVFKFYEGLCGNSWSDMRNNRIFGRVPHSASTLTMRVYDNADQVSTDESVGFREVNLLFSTATTSTYMCAVSQTTPSAGTLCPCREGEYWSGSACTPCHPLCSSCWGGTNAQCFQCAVGSSFISDQCTACSTGCATCTGTGVNQCSQCMTGYYLVNGNTCAQSCEAPLVKSLDSNCRTSCSNPCGTGSFIYWDGSCNSTCAAPLQQDTQIKDFQLCYFPCGETEYLYWDGSCSADCFEPLLIGAYGKRNFCYYTCSTTQYLYWNGTCSDQCLSPFIITTNRGRKLCSRPCKEGEYLYWDGTCSSTCPSPLTARITDGDLYCDYGCASNQILYWDGSCEYTCAYPLTLTAQGTTRPRQYCGYPGTVATNYLYWNGSSLPVCDPPFTKRVTKGKNFCDNSCPSTSFIYWNSSCLGSCPPPFTTYTQAGLQYCDFPCTQSQFYYWDGTCDTTCPTILTQQVTGGSSPRYYCNNPCSSASDFLYWNGSCLGSCGNHFTQTSIHGLQLCHSPCAFTEYLAFNGSCLSNCPLPFAPRKEAGVGFCDYPACLQTQYVAAWNYECIASCDSPLRIVPGDSGIQWCLLPCDDPLDFYYTKSGECKPTCESGAVVQDSLYPQCQAIPKSNSGAPQGFTDLLLTASVVPNKNSFVAFHKLSLPVKFTNIAASPRLQQFILSTSRSILSWDIPISAPDSLKKEFVQRPLPPIFSQHGMISGFIVNCWRYFMLLCIFFITAFLFKVLEKVCQIMTWTNARPAVIKLREIFLWNFCLALVGYFADTFVLYFCVHLSSLLLDNTNETINLFTGCFIMLAIIALALFTLWIVRIYHAGSLFEPQVRDETSKETFYQRWKACLVLYRAYRPNNWRQQNFYAFYIIRMTLPMIITLLCWKAPALQACSQFIINFIMLIYLIFDMPLEKKINQVQIFCYEFGALFVNIAAVMLTFVNNSEHYVTKSYRVILGDMIIFGNVYLNFVPFAFMVAKLYFEAKYVYRYYKKRLNSDGGAWIRLFVIPLQQGLFGFEELLGDKSAISQVLTESPTLKHVKKYTKQHSKIAPSPLDASSSEVKDDYKKGADPFSSSRISLNNSQMNNSTSPLSEKSSRNLSPYEKLRKLKRPTQMASPTLGNSIDEVEVDKGQAPSRIHTADSLNFSNAMQTRSLSPSKIVLDK